CSSDHQHLAIRDRKRRRERLQLMWGGCDLSDPDAERLGDLLRAGTPAASGDDFLSDTDGNEESGVEGTQKREDASLGQRDDDAGVEYGGKRRHGPFAAVCSPASFRSAASIAARFSSPRSTG